MRRAEKAIRIVEILDELIPEIPIPLEHSDPFTLLVAVLLSAQTTDKKVNEVTPDLFAEGGTPQAMSQMTVERIRHLQGSQDQRGRSVPPSSLCTSSLAASR